VGRRWRQVITVTVNDVRWPERAPKPLPVALTAELPTPSVRDIGMAAESDQVAMAQLDLPPGLDADDGDVTASLPAVTPEEPPALAPLSEP
jgi:hypothetical protein